MKHIFFILLIIVLFHYQPVQCGRISPPCGYSSINIDQAKIDLVRMYGLRWYLLRHIGWDDETESGQLHDTIVNRIAYYATPEITPEMKAFILSKIPTPFIDLNYYNKTPIQCFAQNKQGTQIATAESDTVQLWDPLIPGQVGALTNSAPISGLIYNPEKEILAVASRDRAIKLYNLETRECFMSFTGHRGRQQTMTMTFSKRGTYLAAGSLKNTVALWNIVKQHRRLFKGHTGRVNAVLFFPDITYIASASNDSMIKLWNTTTKQCTATLHGHTNSVTTLQYSHPSDQLISASKDCTIRLWDSIENTCITTLLGHEGPITSLACHPTKPLLLSGSKDGTIKLWDLTTHHCLTTFSNKKSQSPVVSVAYSPTADHFISACKDGTLKRYNLSPLNHFMRIMDSPTAEQAIALTAIARSKLCNRTMVKDLARQGINAKPLKKYLK